MIFNFCSWKKILSITFYTCFIIIITCCIISKNKQITPQNDALTVGTCNLASVILNFAEFLALDEMQPSDQFNSR